MVMGFHLSSKHLTERLTHLNQVMEDFWRKWTTEYLLELREAHQHRQKVDKEVLVKPGDVVLVHDEGSPRGFWKMALIKSLIVGKNGQASGAILRVVALLQDVRQSSVILYSIFIH